MPEKELRRDRPGPVASSGRGGDGAPAWYADHLGVVLVTVYAVLAVLGVIAVSGVTDVRGLVGGFDETYYRTHPFQIPPQVLLFAYLGALTHVFTGLVADPDAERKTVLRLGSRIPVALVFASLVYVLLVSLPNQIPIRADLQWRRQLMGTAFLAGLFVEHAVGALRLAFERLLLERVASPLLGRLRNRGR